MIHDPQDPHASGRRSRGYGTMLARLGKLRPGEELVYHRDGEDRCPGAFAAASDAHEQGTVTLTQRRTDGRPHYLATRRTSRG